MTYISFDSNPGGTRLATDDKEGYLNDLTSAAYTLNTVGCDYAGGIYPNVPNSRYYTYATQINNLLALRGYRALAPDRAGATISAQAVLGMALAYRDMGGTEVKTLLTAMQDPRTTGIFRKLTTLGRAGVDDGEPRVMRIENLLGLRVEMINLAGITSAFTKLASAFCYEEDGFFRVSDSTAEDYEAILAEEPGAEYVCPMRSKVEKVFCIIAEAACANEDLVLKDLAP